MKQFWLLLIIGGAFAAGWGASNALKPAGIKPAASLILESANSNENTYVNGEFISVLHGKVVFVYDSIRIRSDEATWWRKKGEVAFRNNITVVRGSQRLTCNRMNYAKQNNSLTAKGNFVYYDTSDRTRLTGDNAEYQLGPKIFNLRGHSILIRYDTTAGDTLTIKSLSMTYRDSIKWASAIDSVQIKKGKLYSTCRLANYFTVARKAELRGKPKVRYGVNRLSGDSINLDFSQKTLRHALIVGHSFGIYADSVTIGKDTTFTHISGDTLDMAMSDSGKPQVIWSLGKASTQSFQGRDPGTANSASGKIMMLSFASGGSAKNLKIWGNARSTYFVTDSSGKGCNEVSGDSVNVLFDNGRAHFVSLAGSTRGIYFPLQ